MNAIATAATPGVVNPPCYEIGLAAGRASLVIDLLKEQLLLPLARGIIQAQQSIEAAQRSLEAGLQEGRGPIAATPEPPSISPSPTSPRSLQALEQPTTSAAAPPPVAPRRHRSAAVPRKRRVANRQQPIRRHRTRRPTAITAAVVEQVFEISRRTLRRWVADGRLRDLREPGHAQNAPLLLDLRQLARRWPRRLGVEVSAKHWVLQLLDEETFFAARPDTLRTHPDIDI